MTTLKVTLNDGTVLTGWKAMLWLPILPFAVVLALIEGRKVTATYKDKPVWESKK